MRPGRLDICAFWALENMSDGEPRRRDLPQRQAQGFRLGAGQIGAVLPHRRQPAASGQHLCHR